MKILHLSSEHPPARIYGLGRFVHGLARAQAALGDDVSVLTNSTGGDQDDVCLEGVHVQRIEFPNPPRPADGHGEVLQFNHGLVSRFFDRRTSFEGTDVVCGHDWLTALAAREIATTLEAPLVVTFHDEVIGKHFGFVDGKTRLVRELEALAAHDATHVIANSEFIAEQVRKHYGAERVTAVYGGIDPDLLETSGSVADFKSVLAEEGETLVTFVGRLDAEKGLEQLAEAALIAGHVKPKLRFVIAGTGRGDALLRTKLAPLGDRVRLLGYVKGAALSLLYRASDIVLVPSIYEPFGLVALEAMLAGAAVIASSAGGLAEIVRHEKDGLVVPPADSDALAEAIVQLAHEPDLRRALVESAHERARTEFSWARVAEKTRTVYENSIETKRPVSLKFPPLPHRPLVSVTLVTHNAEVHAETALRSLFGRTDYPRLEAIVVDNGSAKTEGLEAVIEELRSRGHEIRLLKNESNLLFSRAQNQAIREARGEYVCLLNDDTEIPQGSESWLSGLVWLLETMSAGTVTPVSLERDGRIYCAGAFGNGGHHLRNEPNRDDLVTAPRTTEWNNMACLLTRRRYFDEVGPLSEEKEYAHYKSDLEWCQRLTDRLGLRHWVHPARIYHYSCEPQRTPGAPFAAVTETRLKASIVVVAYNNLDLTVEALEAVLEKTAPPYELVLVDNGSRDGTREYFRSLHDRLGGQVAVQILENQENLGYTLAANQGIRAARGRHVVLLNNDTRVRAGWLAALLDAAESEDRVGIVTAKILSMDGTVQNAGGIFHHPDGSYTLPHAHEDRLAPSVASRRKVESAGGPLMLLTRPLVNEVGVFDEVYSPAYFEDSDLGMRARAAGFSLLYEPKAEVLHIGKATAAVVAAEGKLRLWERFEENKKLFYGRWGSELEKDELARRRSARRPEKARRSRILLCYNKNENTTAAYCESALRREHDVVTAGRSQELDLGDVTAAELLQAAGGADLLLAIEGENYFPREIQGAGCKTAFWAIDAHIHAAHQEEGYFALAREFDHVFLAQRDYAAAFGARGIGTSWLPLACDPEVHRRHQVPRDLEVVFVGNVLPIHERRRALLERLSRRFRVDLVQGVYRDDMARLFSRARIVFNCSLAGDLNMRVFEALATGSLLVTDRARNGMDELLGDEEHLVVYDDPTLEATVARYMEDEALARSIAERGQRLVTRHHTYAHRMRELVEKAMGAKPLQTAVSE